MYTNVYKCKQKTQEGKNKNTNDDRKERRRTHGNGSKIDFYGEKDKDTVRRRKCSYFGLYAFWQFCPKKKKAPGWVQFSVISVGKREVRHSAMNK